MIIRQNGKIVSFSFNLSLIYQKYGSSPKRVVDFRSDWALSWGRPMSRFTRVARSRVSSVTLIPKESPSLHSNQLIYIVYVLTNVIHNFW